MPEPQTPDAAKLTDKEFQQAWTIIHSGSWAYLDDAARQVADAATAKAYPMGVADTEAPWAQSYREVYDLLNNERAAAAALAAASQNVLNEIPECRCDEAFERRNLEDPSCVYHFLGGDHEVEPAPKYRGPRA